MPISVTSLGTASNSTGSTLNLSATVPAGALIVVCVQEFFNGSPAGSVSDASSNSYSVATGGNPNNVTGNGFCRVFYSANVASLSAQNITYSKAGTSAVAISALYATGIATSSPLDSAVTAKAVGSSTSPSVTSGTPSQPGELFVAALGVGPVASYSFTQDTTNGWAAPPASLSLTGSAGGLAGGNQINAGNGTKQFKPTITSAGWFAAVIGFKAAPPVVWRPQRVYLRR